MNTKIYKAVHGLAEKLLAAANKKNQEKFDALYAELKAICEDNEDTHKDHPVQWETLADFTSYYEEALAIYSKALVKAVAIDSKDFMSSIPFAMATLQAELGLVDAAIENLKNAQASAERIEDEDLKVEINKLLTTLLEDTNA